MPTDPKSQPIAMVSVLRRKAAAWRKAPSTGGREAEFADQVDESANQLAAALEAQRQYLFAVADKWEASDPDSTYRSGLAEGLRIAAELLRGDK